MEGFEQIIEVLSGIPKLPIGYCGIVIALNAIAYYISRGNPHLWRRLLYMDMIALALFAITYIIWG